jgi:hypothetical protein
MLALGLACQRSFGWAHCSASGSSWMLDVRWTLEIEAVWRQTRLTVIIDAKIRCQISERGVSCCSAARCRCAVQSRSNNLAADDQGTRMSKIALH